MSRPRTLSIRTTREVNRKFKLRFAADIKDENGAKLDGCVTTCDSIVIDRDLLDSDKLSTLIHEVIHVACPDLGESAVLRIEGAVFDAIKPYLRDRK